MAKQKIMVLGCGFLNSHLLPHLIPHTDQFILVDREKVEQVNYDNYLIPKGYETRRKVTAFTAMLQLMSPAEVDPIHMDVKNSRDLIDLHKAYKPTLAIVGFDNIKARMYAKEYSDEMKIPCLSIAVTEDYAIVDWMERMKFPKTDAEIKRIEDAMKKVKDVCTRLEFRPLGMLSSTLAYYAFISFINDKKKLGYMATTDGQIRITTFGEK